MRPADVMAITKSSIGGATRHRNFLVQLLMRCTTARNWRDRVLNSPHRRAGRISFSAADRRSITVPVLFRLCCSWMTAFPTCVSSGLRA